MGRLPLWAACLPLWAACLPPAWAQRCLVFLWHWTLVPPRVRHLAMLGAAHAQRAPAAWCFNPLLVPQSISSALLPALLPVAPSASATSVLVANNGLAAVKFMRSVRSWAFQTLGSRRAIALVAMATPEDIRVNAEHVTLADQFVEVPGGTNNNNYANVKLIVQIAERAGVDAVWPGWCAAQSRGPGAHARPARGPGAVGEQRWLGACKALCRS